MPVDDPIAMFSALLERAGRECAEPDAMVLSTVDASGRPGARYMLLKGVDERGFVFYTNLGSRKARALTANPYAALTFYWPPLDKQVRVEGDVERVSDADADADADAYFATRPRASQVGAWASKQSATLASQASLDERVREVSGRFDGAPPAVLERFPRRRTVDRVLDARSCQASRTGDLSAPEPRVGTLAPVSVTACFRC